MDDENKGLIIHLRVGWGMNNLSKCDTATENKS